MQINEKNINNNMAYWGVNFTLLIALVFTVSAFANDDITFDKTSLMYYSENYPPMNYAKNEVAVGASVEILAAMWEKMHIEPKKINILPWARAYKTLLSQENAVLFTMSKTNGRESLFKWVGPILSTTHILIARKSAKINIHSIEESFNYRVATIQNDISELSLLNRGFPVVNMQKLTTLDQAIRMLNAKRVDLMLLTDDALPSLLKRHHLSADEVEVVFNVNSVGSYFAFNKRVPDKVVAQFQQAFDAIKPQRANILKHYQLN